MVAPTPLVSDCRCRWTVHAKALTLGRDRVQTISHLYVYGCLCNYISMAELLSVDDVAARLQLRPRTVREYIRAGRLRATRIGKQYRIHIEDLKLIERGTTAPSPDPGDTAATRTTASVVVRVDAASAEQEQRVSSLLNVSGAAPRVALQIVSMPDYHALQVIASGPLDAVLTVLTTINNALEITCD